MADVERGDDGTRDGSPTRSGDAEGRGTRGVCWQWRRTGRLIGGRFCGGARSGSAVGDAWAGSAAAGSAAAGNVSRRWTDSVAGGSSGSATRTGGAQRGSDARAGSTIGGDARGKSVVGDGGSPVISAESVHDSAPEMLRARASGSWTLSQGASSSRTLTQGASTSRVTSQSTSTSRVASRGASTSRVASRGAFGSRASSRGASSSRASSRGASNSQASTSRTMTVSEQPSGPVPPIIFEEERGNYGGRLLDPDRICERDDFLAGDATRTMRCH